MADLRMPDVNYVIIAGRLTRDPELRYTPSNTAVCKMRLASSRNYRDRSGERREDTTFVNVTVWDKQGEMVGERLSKGRPVVVEGSLRSDQWEDQAGQKRNTIEINARRVHMLDWDDAGGGAGGGRAQRPASGGRDRDGGAEEPEPEDDIPF